MKRKIYMAVDLDEYELPYAIADSPGELAEICGTNKNVILSTISHVEAGRAKRSRFVMVTVTDMRDS